MTEMHVSRAAAEGLMYVLAAFRRSDPETMWECVPDKEALLAAIASYTPDPHNVHPFREEWRRIRVLAGFTDHEIDLSEVEIARTMGWIPHLLV